MKQVARFLHAADRQLGKPFAGVGDLNKRVPLQGGGTSNGARGRDQTESVITINKLHFPITTLGYGRRLGIWMQGCSIRCPGCISRDTWDAEPRHRITVAKLIAGCAEWLAEADGVTISGGEPFDQPDALRELLRQLRARNTGDLLVFSGYANEKLSAQHADILALADVLISEPFVAQARQTLALRGSDNQRVFLLTPLARERYPADLDRRAWEPQRRLDLMMEGDSIWMAGIPEPSAMAKLRAQLRAQGYDTATSDQPVPVRA